MEQTKTEKLLQCKACRNFTAAEGEHFCQECRDNLGWMRGSKAALLAYCPGAASLLDEATEDEGSDAAQQGTLLHLATHDRATYASLGPDDQALVLAARERLRDFLGLNCTLDELIDQVEWEVPVVLRKGNGEWVSFGHIDAAYKNHIVDFKFYRTEPVEGAISIQMGIYAGGRCQELGCNVYALVYNPRTGGESEREYDEVMAERVVSALQGIKEKAYRSATIEFHPSPEACLGCYCPAIGFCPATRRNMALVETTPLEEMALAKMPGPKLNRLGVAWKLVKPAGEALEAALRARALCGEEFDDFRIARTSGGRAISDPRAAYSIAADVMSFDQYLSMVKIGLTEFIDQWTRAKKDAEGGTLKDWRKKFDEVFAPVLSVKPEKVSLVLKKGKE